MTSLGVNKGLIFVLLLLLGWSFANTTSADKESTRIRIGLKLFRTILAADTKIKEKKDAKGQLPLTLIYQHNKSDALLYSQKLHYLGKGKNQGHIKEIPLAINTLAIDQLEKLSSFTPAGIYLLEKLDPPSLQRLIAYGTKHQIIIYSPFTGAVEQGVTAGLFIDARVKPYINNNTLKRSQLQLKSFFLKVSKQYEP